MYNNPTKLSMYFFPNMVLRKWCGTDISRNSHQAKYLKNVCKWLQTSYMENYIITQFFKHILSIYQMQITYNFQFDFMLQIFSTFYIFWLFIFIFSFWIVTWKVYLNLKSLLRNKISNPGYSCTNKELLNSTKFQKE